MKLYITLTIFLYFLNSCQSILTEDVPSNKLVSVVVMYRHGDRTLRQSFPKDPFFNKEHIPEGFGAFLDKGKLRHYHLGRWFRQRYSSVLSDRYKANEIKIFSSDHDVCLLSAECNLAGLYKLNSNDEWLDGLPWDPIPVHTRPSEEDSVVSLLEPCRSYDKLYENVKKSKIFSSITKKNEQLIKFLSEKTGWDIQDIDYIRGLYQIFDIYRNYNKTYIPAWAESVDNNKFTELAALAWARETYTPELKRLKTGRFFDNLFSHFDKVIAGKEEPTFLMLASSIHALSAVLNTMNIFEKQPVNFAGTIIWELSKNPIGQDILTVYYKNSTSTTEAPDWKLRGEYKNVKRTLAHYIVDRSTWLHECNVQ